MTSDAGRSRTTESDRRIDDQRRDGDSRRSREADRRSDVDFRRPPGERPGRRSDDRSLLFDALIGAAVTTLLSFVPFSPVLGGGVAGYLHGEDGGWVGAASGILATVPLVLGLYVVFGILSLAFPLGASEIGFFGVVVWVVVFAVSLYAAVLGAIGGLVGAEFSGR